MTPSTPSAMRASLDARIVALATVEGVDAGRVRRRLTFQRMLRRIGPELPWILKGGYLLEARLGNRARRTKDLDLAIVATADLADVRHDLDRVLASDPDGDFIEFVIGRTRALSVDGLQQPGWRFSISARLADRAFCDVRIDVVERASEANDATETVSVESPVAGVGLGPASIRAVDIAQHAAEKFHAMMRNYAGGRASTRVKDLLDIVLMVDAGLLPDTRLRDRLLAVFAARDGAGLPPTIPDPPDRWVGDYERLVRQTPAVADNLADALRVARDIYRQALP